ncbi:hypothetical protein LLH23_01345 [bacterium]|nr:hypothetical protein [bacterium]
MSTETLARVAMGNDCEHYLTTGGNSHLLAEQRAEIIRRCAMPHTDTMPTDEIRWRFPRYCMLRGGGAFYYDVSRESDLLETQTPECGSPFQLAAAQDQNRRILRERLGERIKLGACGYVRGGRRRLTFAGSHLNVSLNDPSLPGLRTALRRDDVRQVMLYFLGTCQVWGGIGVHFGPEWEVRSRAIVTDISNDCISFKGLLQPGREVPAFEVKEIETLHYTHYEAGWARSAYQRALSAATVAMDAHLGCHHTAEVLRLLKERGLEIAPPDPWFTIRLALSQRFGETIHQPVAIGGREWTHLDLLDLRLALYDRLLTEGEKTQVAWVAWALEQLTALRGALERYPGEVSGPLLGLDAVIKHEFVFRPVCQEHGYEPSTVAQTASAAPTSDGDAARLPFVTEAMELQREMFGLNLLYHDFAMADGLYERLMEAYPHVAAWQRAPFGDTADPSYVPPTRSAKRQRLMEAYAAISERSAGRLAPCFAGFDRIGIKLRTDEGQLIHMHHLGNVLNDTVTRDDWLLMQRYADLVGVSAEQVLTEREPT